MVIKSKQLYASMNQNIHTEAGIIIFMWSTMWVCRLVLKQNSSLSRPTSTSFVKLTSNELGRPVSFIYVDVRCLNDRPTVLSACLRLASLITENRLSQFFRKYKGFLLDLYRNRNIVIHSKNYRKHKIVHLFVYLTVEGMLENVFWVLLRGHVYCNRYNVISSFHLPRRVKYLLEVFDNI